MWLFGQFLSILATMITTGPKLWTGRIFLSPWSPSAQCYGGPAGGWWRCVGRWHPECLWREQPAAELRPHRTGPRLKQEEGSDQRTNRRTNQEAEDRRKETQDQPEEEPEIKGNQWTDQNPTRRPGEEGRRRWTRPSTKGVDKPQGRLEVKKQHENRLKQCRRKTQSATREVEKHGTIFLFQV